MKFMQKSLNRQEKKDEIRKIKDESEWALPDYVLIRQSLKPTVLIKSVGYGSIAMAKQDDEKQEKMESNENRFTVDSDAQQFLRSIEKDKKKRKKEHDGEDQKKRNQDGDGEDKKKSKQRRKKMKTASTDDS